MIYQDHIFDADEQAQARAILRGQPTLRDMFSVREVVIACGWPEGLHDA